MLSLESLFMPWQAIAVACLGVVVAFAYRERIAKRFCVSSVTVLVGLGGVLVACGLIWVWELSRAIEPMPRWAIKARIAAQQPPNAEQEREERYQAAREAWIGNSMERLATVAPPPSNLTNWSTDDFIIFSEGGWATYLYQSAHATKFGDLTLLRLSDGSVYISNNHFCLSPHYQWKAQPRNIAHFLELYGAKEGWRKWEP